MRSSPRRTATLSNGCVRVEDAKRLGRWLLGQARFPGDEAETEFSCRSHADYLTYITAQVRDGKLSYLPDIYGWDRNRRFVSS